MRKPKNLQHRFVEFIPSDLDKGVVYISIEYATATHLCCCGCGSEVVTPLSPTDWEITFDGASISISPSIGNWNFACKSHYWIIRNFVHWAEPWEIHKIKANREKDEANKNAYFLINSTQKNGASPDKLTPKATRATCNSKNTFLARIRKLLMLN